MGVIVTMDVALERAPGHTLVTVAGEVDLATAPALASALSEVTEADGPLVIDLTEVAFLDSSGLSVLLQARERLGGGGVVRLVAKRPAILRVLAVTGLDEVFSVFPTVGEAASGS